MPPYSSQSRLKVYWFHDNNNGRQANVTPWKNCVKSHHVSIIGHWMSEWGKKISFSHNFNQNRNAYVCILLWIDFVIRVPASLTQHKYASTAMNIQYKYKKNINFLHQLVGSCWKFSHVPIFFFIYTFCARHLNETIRSELWYHKWKFFC